MTKWETRFAIRFVILVASAPALMIGWAWLVGALALGPFWRNVTLVVIWVTWAAYSFYLWWDVMRYNWRKMLAIPPRGRPEAQARDGKDAAEE